MRHVFPTKEVVHLWAHQAQSDARNAAGNVYFKGPTIYSYRDSRPMARIYTNKRKGRLVLTQYERASVTTAKHQGWVNGAVSHMSSIAVPYVECSYYAGRPIEKQDHESNLAHFQTQIARLLKESQHVLSVQAATWRTATAQGLYQNALDYSAFFGIQRKVPAFPAALFDAAREHAQRIETPDPIRDAAKIRARERKAERDETQLAEYRVKLATHQAYEAQAWRAGGHLTAPDWWHALPRRLKQALTGRRYGWAGLPDAQICMLRVNGDQIETSQGARIPVTHAARIWRLVQACRNAQRLYKKNGHTEHAGPYEIDEVWADGTLKAGCHTIPYAEIELIARTLNLESSNG